MKVYYIVLLLFFAVLLSDVAAGDLPAGAEPPEVVATDGNHFYQEITINSDSAQTDALIHFILPFPFGYSKGVSSYRFYDSSGNPIPFHVFNQTVDGSSVSMRINLSAGANIIYFTGGNLSLPSVQSTSVYDYYFPRVTNSSNISLNIIPPEQFNFAQIETSPFGSYNSTTYVRFNGSQNFHAQFNNTTGQWYWNNSLYVNLSSLSRNETTTNFIILDSSGPNTSVYVFTCRDNTSWMWLDYSYLNGLRDWVGTSISVAGGGSVGRVFNTTAAIGNYTPVMADFGDLVMQPENINGLYVRLVSATTGKTLPFKNMTNTETVQISSAKLSNTLQTQNVYSKDLIFAFSGQSSLKIVQNGTTRTYTPISNYFSGGTTVFVSNIDPLSTFYATTPGYGNLSSHNYTVNLKEQDGDYQRLITLPVTPGLVKGNGSRVYGVVMSSDYGPVPYANLDIRQTAGNSSQLTSLAGGMWGSWFANNSEFVGIASVSGYSDKSFYFYTQNNSTQVFDIYMEKLYNISISVVDENGTAVNSFTSFLGANQSIKSTDNGSVSYTNVPGGETEVVIQASGYNQVSRAIYVGENSTDFTLFVSKSGQETYDTPNYVRFFYRTYTGAPVEGLLVTVSEGNNATEVSNQGVTGYDGSVAFKLDRTIRYTINAANASLGVNHSFSVYPNSSEYVIWVSGQPEEPSEILSELVYSVNNTADEITVNVSLNNTTVTANETVNVSVVVYENGTPIESASGSVTVPASYSRQFSAESGKSYIVSITFEDAHGRTKTVSEAVRTGPTNDELKVLFSLPGFTQQWHYSALCVLIIVLSGLSFSGDTKNIGLLIIPAEYIALTVIGWMPFSTFAICLLLSGVIMAVMNQLDKVDKETV